MALLRRCLLELRALEASRARAEGAPTLSIDLDAAFDQMGDAGWTSEAPVDALEHSENLQPIAWDPAFR